MATITDFGSLPMVGAGGGGILSGISNLFQNKLFLQMLAAGGQAIATGNPAPITQAVNQNISAQGHLGLLQKILGGEMQGAEAKVTDKGLTFNFKRETPVGDISGPDPGMTGVSQLKAYEGVGSTPVGQPAAAPAAAPASAPAQGGQQNEMASLIQNLLLKGPSSPFAGSRISASDLAGVSPEMISDVVRLKFAQDEMANRRLAEISDMMYKGKLMEYYDSQMTENKSQAEIAKINAMRLAAKEEFDQQVSADTSMREWYKALKPEEKSNFEKEYTFAKANGYKGDVASWKTLSQDPTSVEEYQYAIRGGYKGSYTDFLLKYKKSDTNINLSPYEQTKQRGSAQAELDVTDPKYFSDVETRLSKAEDWDYPAEARQYQADQKAKGIEVGPREAAARAQKLRVLKQISLEVEQAYTGKGTVEMKKDGWYLNGKLIVRNPYAPKN